MLADRYDEPGALATQHLGAGPFDPSVDGDLGNRDGKERDEKGDDNSHLGLSQP